jgi:hypothetical protein
MEPAEFSILFIVVAFAAIAIIFALINRRGRQAAWSDLAARAGLAYEPGSFWGRSPMVSGVYRGRSLALDTFTTQTGKNRTTYTRLAVALKDPAPISLSISGEDLGSKLGKLVGMKEITLGDEELDRRLFIRGEPELPVQRLFSNAMLRQKLLEARLGNIMVNDRTVSYQRRGFESNPETMQSLFDLLVEIAMSVERLSQ